jgi:hypothetical protein
VLKKHEPPEKTKEPLKNQKTKTPNGEKTRKGRKTNNEHYVEL